MSDIPSEIYHHIFCRVPTESLLTLKSVCRLWRQLIDDPYFVKLQINHQLSSSIGHLLIRKHKGGKLYSLSLDHLDINNGNQMVEATPIKNLSRLGVPRLHHFSVPSCNGLILIANDYDVRRKCVLWNPLNQDFHELPECEASNAHLKASGLGYDCANDDYKVVRIFEMDHGQNLVYKTLVYSLKSDSWKRIKDCPHVVPQFHNGLYLNGSLYWISQDFIIVLDLSTEAYRQLELPIEVSGRRGWFMDLDSVGECLVLKCRNILEKCVDGWVMKDDGGNISWTRLFLSEYSDDDSDTAGAIEHVRLITYLTSKAHVFNVRYPDSYFRLDGKKIQIDKINDRFSCQIWMPSLVKLDNNINGKRKRAKKRLQLCLKITEEAGVQVNQGSREISRPSIEGEDN